MLNKSLFINGVLVAVHFLDARKNRRNKALITQLENDNIELCHEWQKAQARIKYLAAMIDTNEIVLDEFDFIMLNDPTV